MKKRLPFGRRFYLQILKSLSVKIGTKTFLKSYLFLVKVISILFIYTF